MEKNSNDDRVQDNLQELIRQKEASIQAKGRLIDNMAYQIRTLSNAVIGFSDLLLSERLTDELKEYVNEINQAGNGLSSLVNEVLDWARLESGRLKVTRTKCDLSDLVRNLENIITSSAADKGLDYQIEVDPDLPAQIITDEDRLLKCLINLVANAFNNTRQGSVRIRILSACVDGEPCLRVDVSDSGTGMTPEQIAQVFEPAFNAEEANNEVLTMLDMGFTVTAGLPLTKQLIELLGGTLSVTSRLNEGSTFSLVLPTGSLTGEVGKLGVSSPVEQSGPLESETSPQLPCILLVEDQQSNRMVISLMLEALGVTVETAEDGCEGVEKASHKQYDLVLMDLKMPRMDGYQASQIIRENRPQMPIVALSAKVLNEQENQQIMYTFDGFLTKPIDSRKLSETIGKFITGLNADSHEQTAAASKTATGNTDEVVTFEYGK
jgi:CheY-like chemotaxis protein/nitrogen-specific signal transduction histidine kinase